MDNKIEEGCTILLLLTQYEKYGKVYEPTGRTSSYQTALTEEFLTKLDNDYRSRIPIGKRIYEDIITKGKTKRCMQSKFYNCYFLVTFVDVISKTNTPLKNYFLAC